MLPHIVADRTAVPNGSPSMVMRSCGNVPGVASNQRESRNPIWGDRRHFKRHDSAEREARKCKVRRRAFKQFSRQRSNRREPVHIADKDRTPSRRPDDLRKEPVITQGTRQQHQRQHFGWRELRLH